LTPNEHMLTFGGLHLCVKFGENRQRNATVRVTTHGQTDRQTHTDIQTQTDFFICPMLYVIAMGQIKKATSQTGRGLGLASDKLTFSLAFGIILQ